MAKVGFIGMGNMGYALAKGLLLGMESEELIFSCLTAEKKEKVSAETGILAAENNINVVKASDMVILAIKPQMFEGVFEEIKSHVRDNMIFVSLAPGKSIAYIKDALGGNVRVVRAMPNTPALIGHGVTGVAYNEAEFNQAEIEMIDRLFSATGTYVKVEEELMSAVVCASGSSPAYVYMFINELAKACAAKGLPYEDAKKLVAGAVAGAALMVLHTGEDPEVLKQKVCSKGGTTIEGVNKLTEMGFSEAIWAATEACYNRSEELGKN